MENCIISVASAASYVLRSIYSNTSDLGSNKTLVESLKNTPYCPLERRYPTPYLDE